MSRPVLVGAGSLAVIAAAAGPAAADPTAGRGAPSAPASTVAFWGSFGTAGSVSSPLTTPFPVYLPGAVRQIGTSNSTAYALLTNGSVYAWGLGANGQLGVPLRVKLPGRVREAFLGGSLPRNGQTLVLLDNGSLYAWGDGRHYQLGTGTTASQPSPVRVPLRPGLRFTKIATSGATSYGITRGGDLYAWGDNEFGQVGNGSKVNAPAPVFVLGGVRDASGTNFDVAVSLRDGGSYRR